MGALIEHFCKECGFSFKQNRGGGMARPTQSFNSDFVEWSCKDCKNAGTHLQIHPIGCLKLIHGQTYYARIWSDLIKVEKYRWLSKILKMKKWLPDVHADSYFPVGRIYEEDFLTKPNSYLSVPHEISFTNANLLNHDWVKWTLYEKFVQVRATQRESEFSEGTRKDNGWPSHQFVFEILVDERGEICFLDDPNHNCPECQSTNFRYGVHYCPVCDNGLEEQVIGMRD